MKRLLIPAILLGFLMAVTAVSASEVVDAPVIIETQTLPTIDLDTPITSQGELHPNTPTSDGFTGNDQIVYASLKDQIQQVAAGQRDSAVLTVSLADLGFSTTEQYPESYFGLSGVFYWDEASQKYLRDNEKYNVAVSEMRSWLEVNTTTIFHSLHADLPYDMYWTGSSMTPQSCPIGCSYSYYPSTHETSTVFYFTGSDTFAEGLAYTFSFSVDTPYLGSSSDPYSVNTAATASAASTTNTTANDIVSAASTMSDYEKLVYYKEQIGQLTSYNTAALESGGPANYGSRCPWNVVWAFDNDTSTNVVCEGYAKAFKYLCDLTDFDDASIKCYTVTGDMDGGTGAGAHMWNVVRMPDGQNYLVDVTNCDEGTIGYPDLLFMAGMNSGNVNSYTVEGVSYTYDAETTSLYTTAELTLASADYEYIPEIQLWCNDTYNLATESGINLDEIAFWSSSESSIVSVDAGTVTAISPGAAVVTAYDDSMDVVATWHFTVHQREAVSIEVTTPPSKTSYITGESFDPAGMVVTVHYNNGENSTVALSSCIFTPTVLTTGTTEVVITWNALTTTTPITVAENVVVSVSIISAPSQAYVGDRLEDLDILIRVSWSDGSSNVLASGWEPYPSRALTKADTSFYVTFQGVRSGNRTINVIDRVVEEVDTEFADGVKLNAKSLSLSGNIGVNFKMTVPEQYVSDSSMTFTVHGRTQTVQTSSLTPNDAGQYVFTCYVTSIEMAEEIQATFNYGTNTASMSYSVADYIQAYDAVSGNYPEETTALVHALADYGHHAQTFLSKYRSWTIGNEYAEMAGYNDSFSADELAAVQNDVQDYALNYTTNADISAVNISLNLESETSIYVYLTPTSGYTGSLTCAEGCTVEKIGNRYRVVIPNIMAHQLGETHTLHLTTSSGSVVVNVSALSYANSIFNNSSMNEVDRCFAAALYNYYVKAASIN